MNSDYKNMSTDLIHFIKQCPSPFHVVKRLENDLINNDYKYLDLTEKWETKRGGKYYTHRNTALFAFQIGNGEPEEDGFKLISAHSDSPCFKIKPSPEIFVENHFVKLNTEVYGGPILMSWFDRPLSVAGRIIVKSSDPIHPKQILINIDRPLLTIPNLAIHMNRQVNEGLNINKQVDMLPIIGIITEAMQKNNYLLNLITKEYDIKISDIIDFDLFIYNYEEGCLLGGNNEFISAPRLDDLAMVQAALVSFLDSQPSKGSNILCVFDNEEVGSLSKQGADAPLLKNIIHRIMSSLGKDEEEFIRSIYQSFMISADMAHSLHPNYTEKHDPVLHPKINMGPVIKYHAGQKYTTDGDSGGVFEQICRLAKIPVQRFVNRSDIVGGSTLGNVSTGQIDFRTVDVGNAMFAMHSARELAGVLDHEYMIKAFKQFYNL